MALPTKLGWPDAGMDHILRCWLEFKANFCPGAFGYADKAIRMGFYRGVIECRMFRKTAEECIRRKITTKEDVTFREHMIDEELQDFWNDPRNHVRLLNLGKRINSIRDWLSKKMEQDRNST